MGWRIWTRSSRTHRVKEPLKYWNSNELLLVTLNINDQCMFCCVRSFRRFDLCKVQILNHHGPWTFKVKWGQLRSNFSCNDHSILRITQKCDLSSWWRIIVKADRIWSQRLNHEMWIAISFVILIIIIIVWWLLKVFNQNSRIFTNIWLDIANFWPDIANFWPILPIFG